MNAVGIVGLGQIGGSIAKALMQAHVPVIGFDTDPATQQAAERLGVTLASDLQELTATSATVFCCVSIASNEATLQRLIDLTAPMSKPPTISDVASYKRGVLPCLAGVTNVVPGHPMAGSHSFGFGSSTASLFHDAVWNFVVEDGVAVDRLIVLMELVIKLGARVHLCSEAWHDETVSLVSALPHAFALVLGHLAATTPGAERRLELAAGSFSGATRVLLSDPRFFKDLLAFNRSTLLPLIAQARQQLLEIERVLDVDDTPSLARMITVARSKVDAWRGSATAVRKVALSRAEFSSGLLSLRDTGQSIGRMTITEGCVNLEIHSRQSDFF